jgi:hypothetical protein
MFSPRVRRPFTCVNDSQSKQEKCVFMLMKGNKINLTIIGEGRGCGLIWKGLWIDLEGVED